MKKHLTAKWDRRYIRAGWNLDARSGSCSPHAIRNKDQIEPVQAQFSLVPKVGEEYMAAPEGHL